MPNKKMGRGLAFQSKVCYNIRMDLTDTKLSKNEILGVFDSLHDAVEALHKAYNLAKSRDPILAAALWKEVAWPAGGIVLNVTGDLLKAALSKEEAEATA